MAISLTDYVNNTNIKAFMQADEAKELDDLCKHTKTLSDYSTELSDEDITHIAKQMLNLSEEYINSSNDLDHCPSFLHSSDFTFDPETKKVSLLPHSFLQARALYEKKSTHNLQHNNRISSHEMYFAPPENITPIEHQSSHKSLDKQKELLEKSYVYSVGAIAHYLATGSKAFAQQTHNPFQIAIRTLQESYSVPKKLQESSLGNFLEKSFEKSPNKRLGFAKALGALDTIKVPTLEESQEEKSAKALRKNLFTALKIPATDLHRKYPELGTNDTTRMNRGRFKALLQLSREIETNQTFQKLFPELCNLSFFGVHGYSSSYKDQDILHVHPIVHTQLYEDIPIDFTTHNKPIIQQQSNRGCTAAATFMLIYEHGKSIDTDRLQMRNIGTNSMMLKDIQQVGLKPVESSCTNLSELQLSLEKHGPAIVTVNNSGLKGHVVVVDEILKDSVRLRDPYHGWEVDVKLTAFEESWSKKLPIIQINNETI